jgi:hypothetical protein
MSEQPSTPAEPGEPAESTNEQPTASLPPAAPPPPVGPPPAAPPRPARPQPVWLVPGAIGLIGIMMGIWIGAWGVILVSNVWHHGFDRHGDDRGSFQKRGPMMPPRGQMPNRNPGGQFPQRKLPQIQPPQPANPNPANPAPTPSPSATS